MMSCEPGKLERAFSPVQLRAESTRARRRTSLMPQLECSLMPGCDRKAPRCREWHSRSCRARKVHHTAACGRVQRKDKRSQNGPPPARAVNLRKLVEDESGGHLAATGDAELGEDRLEVVLHGGGRGGRSAVAQTSALAGRALDRSCRAAAAALRWSAGARHCCCAPVRTQSVTAARGRAPAAVSKLGCTLAPIVHGL